MLANEVFDSVGEQAQRGWEAARIRLGFFIDVLFGVAGVAEQFFDGLVELLHQLDLGVDRLADLVHDPLDDIERRCRHLFHIALWSIYRPLRQYIDAEICQRPPYLARSDIDADYISTPRIKL